ncbi:hypothetical protein CN176_03490 [Sinorhizobium medicae]|uniref:hypothetical protein n=1 Tax=Sinorhizobium medicae TaxID=110321 RepID=UPI000FDB88C9|nr:hypothetical protein [Sinorhizobium medicae]RVJ45861.1 hypothetical protein CN176_03490 [Sinorhizobium medicae]
MTRASLCQTFLELGDAVSRNLDLAYRCAISYGEETITETSLLEIWRRHSSIVNIKTFSRRQEAQSGADREWHLIGRKYTLKMRAQAKWLAKNGQQIKSLFSYKARKSPRPQLDMLVADAAIRGASPCPLRLQHGSIENDMDRIHNAHGRTCGIGPVETIRNRGSKYLFSIEQMCVPWLVLVCSRSYFNSPFPSIDFLNGAAPESSKGAWTSAPYVVPTDADEGDRRVRVDVGFELPEDYTPSPVSGLITIDCREVD